MRNEIIQVEIEKVRNETTFGGNTCQRIASIYTQLNDSKVENNELTDKLNEKASLVDLDLKPNLNADNLTPQHVDAWNTKLKTLSDAPSDNKQYARKNGAWEEITASGGAEAPAPKINIKGCSLAGNKYVRLEFEVYGYPEFINDYESILAESLLCLSIDAAEFLLDNLRETILTNYGTGNDYAGVFIEVELPASVTTALENHNHSNQFNFACYLKLKHGTGYIQENFFYKNTSRYNQSGYVDITFKTGKNPATDFSSATETGVLNLSKDIDVMPINKQLTFLNDNTQMPFGTSYDLSQTFLNNGRLVPNTAIAQVTDWEFDLAVEDGNMAISYTSPWCIVAEKELEGGTFEVVGYGVITDNWTGGETNRNSRAVVRTITTSDMLFGSRKGLRFRVQPTKFMEGSQLQVKVAVNKVRRISYSVN
jgi:hypothetical protein